MPSSLQGLNIVHPPSRSTASQDLLELPSGLPDLAAQLDLWTHLSFASDEPYNDKHMLVRKPESTGLQSGLLKAEEAKEMNQNTPLITISDKQLQTSVTPSIISPDDQPSSQTHESPGPFDLGSFLAGFGIDPFIVPPQPDPQSTLLTQPSLSSPSAPSDVSRNSLSQLDGDVPPPSKRSRPRKNSTSSQAPSIISAALKQAEISSVRAVSELSDDHDPLTTPLTPAEDKRRRNTAASARFRAKKKEREQALEKRSKELETRVNELERECEGLRRENGWLKGLVVGVTGSNPALAGDDAAGHEANKKRKRETDSGSLGG